MGTSDQEMFILCIKNGQLSLPPSYRASYQRVQTLLIYADVYHAQTTTMRIENGHPHS